MDILGILSFTLLVLVGLVILTILVVVHELGHAIVARRNGVVVEEFGLGIPPRAWGKQLKNGVLFSLNWLPIGGFVKMQGENDAAEKEGDFGAASFWAKTKIMFAGVAVNWLLAAALFTVLAWMGLPKLIPNQFSVPADTSITKSPVLVAGVIDGSPADSIGLEPGDKILSLEGKPVSSPEALSRRTQANSGETVSIIYKSDGERQRTKVTLNRASAQAYLGVYPQQRQFIHATWSAPIVGVGTTVQLTIFTVKALGELVANLAVGLYHKVQFASQTAQQVAEQKLSKVSRSVAGPVSIVGSLFPAAQKAGFDILLMFTAVISMTLAIMNVLPIPGLDGGRWFVIAGFKLTKKRLTKEREEKIIGGGMLVLIGILILVTIDDITGLLS